MLEFNERGLTMPKIDVLMERQQRSEKDLNSLGLKVDCQEKEFTKATSALYDTISKRTEYLSKAIQTYTIAINEKIAEQKEQLIAASQKNYDDLTDQFTGLYRMLFLEALGILVAIGVALVTKGK